MFGAPLAIEGIAAFALEATLAKVWELLTNRFVLYALSHTMLVALTPGWLVVLGVACWHLARGAQRRAVPPCGRAR